MTDTRTETTFEISATSAEAWKALEGLRMRAGEPGEWWIPGFDCRGAEIDVEPERRLTVRKVEQPCADSVIDITFEHLDSGTRIRVVQSGFDEAFVKFVGEAFFTHSAHIYADMHVFFATGVVARRAWLPWISLGLAVRAEPLGLRVIAVHPGMWAERAGLQADDILLTLAGAPLYTPSDLGVVERIVRPGDDVAGTWLRGSDPGESSATV